MSNYQTHILYGCVFIGNSLLNQLKSVTICGQLLCDSVIIHLKCYKNIKRYFIRKTSIFSYICIYALCILDKQIDIGHVLFVLK